MITDTDGTIFLKSQLPIEHGFGLANFDEIIFFENGI